MVSDTMSIRLYRLVKTERHTQLVDGTHLAHRSDPNTSLHLYHYQPSGFCFLIWFSMCTRESRYTYDMHDTSDCSHICMPVVGTRVHWSWRWNISWSCSNIKGRASNRIELTIGYHENFVWMMSHHFSSSPISALIISCLVFESHRKWALSPRR